MKTRLVGLGLVVSAGLASAQGTGTIWYEASTDGVDWVSEYLLLTPDVPSCLVRVRAAWSADLGMYAFGGAQFDVTITESAADSITEISRPGPVGAILQTVVATRFGSTTKLDDARDTSAPGAGTRGVFPGQLVQAFAGTNFSTDNPITIFQFRLNFGDATIRQLSSLYIAPAGGDTVSRYMRVYTSPTGAQNTPISTTTGMTIDNYTPAPGAAVSLLAAASIAAARRRRA